VEVDEASMLDRIRRRDEIDSTREDGPLICPVDSVKIDTSPLSVSGVIDEMERVVRERVSSLIDPDG